MRSRKLLVVLLFSLSIAMQSRAATVTVLVDADRNVTSGCSLHGLTGAEQSFIVTIDATTSTTTSVQRRECSNGIFLDPIAVRGASPAPLVDSTRQIEIGVPFSEMPATYPASLVRLSFLFQADDGVLTEFATLPDGSPILSPRVSPGRRRAVRPADGRQPIVIDGRIEDWARVEPELDRGLHTVFVHSGLEQLFFRFDLRESSQPPVAADDAYAVRQGRTLIVDAPGVLENDSDADGSDLTAVLSAPTTHGSLNLSADGSFVYLNDGSLGPDGFDYKASDGAMESNAARVTISVTPNAAPVGLADTYATNRGETLSVPAPGVLGNDSDADADPLTATVATPPARGTVSLSADGSLTYVHSGSPEATDAFSYIVSDGVASSAPVAVTIQVAGSNSAPSGEPDSFTTEEDVPLIVGTPGVLANDFDPDDDPFVAEIATNPTKGNVILNVDGSFVYTPDPGTSGSDSFAYRLSDGEFVSSVITVSIEVTAVNDVPDAIGDTRSVSEDAVLTFPVSELTANDSPGAFEPEQSVTVTAVSAPVNGTVSLSAGVVTFTPSPDFSGTASFVYTITDDGTPARTDNATVTVNVSAINDVPVAGDDSKVTSEDTPITFPVADLLANDNAGPSEGSQTLTLTLGAATNGTVSANAGGITFTPAPDFFGTASFAYTITDNGTTNGAADPLSATATVTITVSAVNDAPVFTTAAITAATEDTSYQYDIVTSDADAGTTLTITAASALPAWLTLTPTGNGTAQLSGTPTNGEVGNHSISLQVTDGIVPVAQSFTIVVANVNDAPVFTSAAVTAATEDTVYQYDVATSDVDAGTTLTITASTSLPAWLTLTATGNGTAQLSGTPTNGEVGNHPITLTVTDGIAPVMQSFTIIVANVNDAPVAVADAGAVAEDGVLVASGNVRTNDGDDDGDTLSVAPLSATGTYGSVVIAADGSFTYTLANGASNVQALAQGAVVTDSFSYVVSDGNGGSGSATLTITITGVNDAPTFTSSANTSATEDQAYLYAITTGDVDTGAVRTITSDPLPGSWITLTDNGDGTATLAALPLNEHVGSHAIALHTSDGITTTTQSFTLAVANVNDAPVATPNVGAVTEDDATSTVSGNVLSDDTDDDGDTLSVSPLVNATGTYGSVTVAADGAFTYTLDNSLPVVQALAAGATVTDSFTYTAIDGNSGSDTASITITITGTNDAPAFTSAPVTAATEDALYSYSIAAADVDTGATLDITASGVPAWLTFTDNNDGTATLSGTPTNDEVPGPFSITLSVSDGIAAAVQQAFAITVANTNDAPVANADANAIVEDAATLTLNDNVLTNDTDVDTGATLSVSAVAGVPANVAMPVAGTYGSVTIAANGSYSYTLANASAVVQALNGGQIVTDTFVYTASDGNGGLSDATLTVTITGVNDAPVFTSSAITSATEDALYTYAIVTDDADASATLDITASGVPPWLTFTDNNDGTATLSGTPSNDEVPGPFSITLSVSDGVAAPVQQAFAITVTNTNDAPVANADANAIVEDAATLTLNDNVLTNDTDVDSGATLSVSAVAGVPANVAAPVAGTYGSVTIAANGSYSYTLANASAVVQALDGGQIVTDAFVYTASDGNGGTSDATLTVTITGVNDAPVFTSSAITSATEDALYTYAIVTDDADASATLDITASGVPAWLTFTDNNDGTATLTGTPTNNEVPGPYGITLSVSDGIAAAVQQAFAITVTNTNDAPVANPDAAAVAEDGTLTANGNVKGNDVDVDAGDSTVVSAVNGVPANVGNPVASTYGSVTIASSGAYSYTLNNAAAQALAAGHQVAEIFAYTITDTASAASSSTLTVTITGANDAPVAVADSYNLPVGGTLNATTVLANDTDADTVPSAQARTAALVSDDTAQGDLTFNADGTFTYVKTCSPCGSNSDSFTYRVSDGITNSNTVTVTIQFNSPPVAVADSFAATEDIELVVAAPGVRVNDSDADGNITKVILVSGPTSGSFTTTIPAGDDALLDDGSFRYTPAPDFAGTATFTYRLEDAAGAQSGTVTATITVASINDAPFFTPGSVSLTVNEDSGLSSLTGWATNVRPGPVTATNESTQTLTFLIAPASVKADVNNPGGSGISCTGSAGSGTLFCSSSEEIGNTAITRVGTTSNATLSFRTWPNAYGSVTFTAQLQDNGGVANGGVNVYPSTPVNVTVNVLPVNDPPSFSLSQTSISRNEDDGLIVLGGHAGSPTYFANTFNPGPNESSQAFVSYTLTADDPSLFAELSIDAATGQLRARPVPNAFGSTTLRVTAKDNGGTANGGIDTLQKSVPITYLAVNDRPSFQRGPDVYVATNSGAYSQPWVASASAGPANESAQVLTYSATSNNSALFSAQPAISSAGVLSFTPAAGASGSAVVTVGISDNGGTANGGVNGGYSNTFVIVVGNVNTPPTFNLLGDVEVLEDSPETTIANFVTAVSPGANASESGQTVSFTITPQFTQFISGPTLVPNGANYDLKFRVAANYGGQIQTITVTATDNGGVAGGGLNTASKTFRFTQHHVNDTPSFTIPASAPTTFSDAGPQTVNAFATAITAGEGCQGLTFVVTANTNPSLFSVAPAIAGSTGCTFPTGNLTYTAAPGQFGTAQITVVLRDDNTTPLNPEDDATSGPQTFTITIQQFTGNVNDVPSFVKGADQTVPEDAPAQTITPWATAISQGGDDTGQIVTFLVTTNNNALFSALPAVSSTGTLTYTPAANVSGSAVVTVRATDNGGTGGGGQNTSAPQTFTISVTAVNDPPTFTASNVQVAQDAPAQSLTNWISAFSPGPNESSQTVTYSVTFTSVNPNLFSVAPAMSGRNLTFTPAPGQFGLAQLSVTATDNGGTAGGGVNSTTQNYTLSIGNVNDPPSFTKGANQTVNEDAGARTITNWASAVSPGAADESAQILTFNIVGNSNPSLFSAGPTVTRTGTTATLAYTPAANLSGSATIDVVLVDDGGTANGGVNTSAVQTFTITVNPVNDRPTFDVAANAPASEDDDGPQSVTGFATNVVVGPADESTQTITYQIVGNTNAALFSAGPAISPAGTLTFTAATYGFADLTVNVKDSGGTANGGIDTSLNKSFRITVTRNNLPVATAKSYQTHAGLTVSIPAASGLLSGVTGGVGTVTVSAVTDLYTISPTNKAEVTFNASTGAFTYKPAGGHVGTETFQYVVCDNRVPPACSAPATVTVNVTGVATVYVDDSAAAGGDGTLAKPYNTYYRPKPGEIVFMFSGNYSDVENQVFIENGVKLYGQGMTGTFDSLFGIVTPPVGTLQSRPSLGGSRPVLTHQYGGSIYPGSTIRGIEFRPGANGAAFSTLPQGNPYGTGQVIIDQVKVVANNASAVSTILGTDLVITNSIIEVTNGNVLGSAFHPAGSLVKFENCTITGTNASIYTVQSEGTFEFLNTSISLNGTGPSMPSAIYMAQHTNSTVTFTGAVSVSNGWVNLDSTGGSLAFRGGLTVSAPVGQNPLYLKWGTVAITGTTNTLTGGVNSWPSAGLSIVDSAVHADGVRFQTVNINGGSPSGSNAGIRLQNLSGTGTVLINGGTVQNVTTCKDIDAASIPRANVAAVNCL